ncbi:hypothetical protein FRC08_002587 [Ceratobasidium sp. 394]|nr:hypothetical protein FRC08_002587 [Ceratobasidium sp. 394]
MSSAPGSSTHPSGSLDHFDYEHLSTLVAEKVAERVIDLVATRPGVGPQRHPKEKKGKERCRIVQRIITHKLKEDPLISGGSGEAPWEIDWFEQPDHPSNRDTVECWVGKVMQDKEMIQLHKKRQITDEQFTEGYIRSLVPHTFDSARNFIKINRDESGKRAQKLKESKERSKRKERRRELAKQRQQIALERTWHGKPIPAAFFEPEYHSDSESDPAPDLSNMEVIIPMSDYQKLRDGADYEMLSPGWRSQEITKLFHWLTKEYRHAKGNRPQGTRYYHSSPRRFEISDIPDGVPRCMIDDKVYEGRMDDAKRALVGKSPEGW